MADEHHNMKIMKNMALAVILPARAIAAAFPMPTTSNVKTSGMTVIRNALSHMFPTTSAVSTSHSDLVPTDKPIKTPAIKAMRMISAFLMKPAPENSNAMLNHAQSGLATHHWM